jgi:hypothetical protein
MFSWQADRDVTFLLEWFIPAARAIAKKAKLNTFHHRLAAVQDLGKELHYLEDMWFGWFDPESYDEHGNRKE